MFFLEVQQWTFQNEIIISGLIIIITFGIQLFMGIKHYREDIRISYELEKQNRLNKPKKFDIIRKGSQYRGFVIRYIIVGFTIYFHLVLLIITTSRIVVTGIGSFAWAYGFFLSTVAFYGLQKLVFKGANSITAFPCLRNRIYSEELQMILTHFTNFSSKSFLFYHHQHKKFDDFCYL